MIVRNSSKIRKKVTLFMALAMALSSAIPCFAVEYGQELSNAPVKEYQVSFSDVGKNHWAFQYIGEMVDRKALSGYPDGEYKPDGLVTRGEFAKIMVKAADIEVDVNNTGTVFADMKKHWARPFVNASSNYMTGYVDSNGNNNFRPNSQALREDIAVALVKLKGYDTSLADLSLLDTMFADSESISKQVKPYVAVAVEKGLISGYQDKTFRGQNSITRAEAAALLWRAFQYGNANKVISTGAPQISSDTTIKVSGQDVVKQEPVPQTQVKKGFKTETILTGVKNLKSMVVDNSGVIYYLDGRIVKSTDGDSLNLDTDFTYPLEKEDKNYDFSMGGAGLAYDEYNDKLYVRALRYNVDAWVPILVFELIDGKPVLRMGQDIDFKAITNGTQGVYLFKEAEFFSNGTFIQRYNGVDSGYIANPQRSEVLKSTYTINYDNKIVGDNIIAIKNNQLNTYDISGNLLSETSIQGGVDSTSVRSMGDKLYFWDSKIGLAYINMKGYKTNCIAFDDIAFSDSKPMPTSIDYFHVKKDGTFIFYDEGSSSIRQIVKNN